MDLFFTIKLTYVLRPLVIYEQNKLCSIDEDGSAFRQNVTQISHELNSEVTWKLR